MPSAVAKLLAGDWNADETRQHDWFEAELLVEMRPWSSGVADLFPAAHGEVNGAHVLLARRPIRIRVRHDETTGTMNANR